MAEGTTEDAIRLRDWIILIFVLVVMGLLITDIGGNVKDIFDRNQEPASMRPAPTDIFSPPKTIP
jgi:hypothetical protein